MTTKTPTKRRSAASLLPDLKVPPALKTQTYWMGLRQDFPHFGNVSVAHINFPRCVNRITRDDKKSGLSKLSRGENEPGVICELTADQLELLKQRLPQYVLRRGAEKENGSGVAAVVIKIPTDAEIEALAKVVPPRFPARFTAQTGDQGVAELIYLVACPTARRPDRIGDEDYVLPESLAVLGVPIPNETKSALREVD